MQRVPPSARDGRGDFGLFNSLHRSSDEQSSAGSKRSPVKRKRVVAATLFVIIIVGPIVLFFLGPLAVGAYDARHPLMVRCTVDSVAVGTTFTRSLKGVGASSTLVAIDTKTCGELLIDRGVNAQNAEAIAARFRKGAAYDFTVGEATWNLRALFALLKVSPDVLNYKSVAS